MQHFVDRRQNPKDKNLGNRQRFMRRARAQIKKVVNESIKQRSISDVASGETVTIPTKGIAEPRLRHSSSGGQRENVFTGNKQFVAGDQIEKPPSGGAGGRGKEGSDQGEGEDEFQFALSREEFLDLFFEDLELPDLVKVNLKEVRAWQRRRAGHTVAGSPTNLDLLRTMRNSYGRRLAMKRPRESEVDELKAEILALEARQPLDADDLLRLKALHDEVEALEKRRRFVPFIDPIDIRYRALQPQPRPNTQAVMFCLMDVSGSMGEREKDLAKRFFVLLHLFLKRRYEKIDVVFVRHTHEASEVDEQTFFYSRESGGTVVSTAIAEALKIVKARYQADQWNIYVAQASDGENYADDSERCIELLSEHLMPLTQYYAYVEILDERESELFRDASTGAALWRAYKQVGERWKNFAMKRIARPGDIYPVFRELFAKHREAK